MQEACRWPERVNDFAAPLVVNLLRGLVGNLGEHTVVASPLYKNHFNLRTGVCQETPEHSVSAPNVQVKNGRVLVMLHTGA